MRRHFTKIVCIRFTQADFDVIASDRFGGYPGLAVSKKIRRVLEPALQLARARRDEDRANDAKAKPVKAVTPRPTAKSGPSRKKAKA